MFALIRLQDIHGTIDVTIDELTYDRILRFPDGRGRS